MLKAWALKSDRLGYLILSKFSLFISIDFSVK